MPVVTNQIDHPMTVVVAAHQYRLENIDDFPSMQNEKTLLTVQEGDVLKVERIVDVLEDLPQILRDALPQAAKTFVEHLSFDRAAGREDFDMHVENKPDKFSIRGSIQYREISENLTERTVNFEVNINYLFFGALKGAVEASYVKGLNSEVEDISRVIESGTVQI